jgi:hypothetical protein
MYPDMAVGGSIVQPGPLSRISLRSTRTTISKS